MCKLIGVGATMPDSIEECRVDLGAFATRRGTARGVHLGLMKGPLVLPEAEGAPTRPTRTRST